MKKLTPVQRFKQRFRNGGNIPKFQAPWKPLERQFVPDEDRQQALQEFVQTGNERTRQMSQTADAQNKQLVKARTTSMKRNGATRNVADLQDALWKIGAFKGVKNKKGQQLTYSEAVDGLRARNGKEATDIALSWARANGFDVDEHKGTVTRKQSAPQKQNTPQRRQPATTAETAIQPLSLEKASKLYQNGAGSENIYASGAFHGLAPESWAMPHSEKLKDQVAAVIAYNEGLPAIQRAKDPYSIPGMTYVGYDTYGRLSNNGSNINDQTNDNNATSKVIGGLRYRINDDGSVDMEDNYGFNVTRDFSRKNSHGQPYVYKKGEDPYSGKEWRGLYHDITTSGEGKSLQNIMENFFTRQGKVRKNNIHFEPGEINRRNNFVQ